MVLGEVDYSKENYIKAKRLIKEHRLIANDKTFDLGERLIAFERANTLGRFIKEYKFKK